ncbi:MAG: GNAT family protein, partial [Bacteroidota bacterium]
EALKAMLDFGFRQLEAQRIEAAYAIWNKASERVLHKNGFRFVKLIEKAFQKKGEWVDENFVVVEKNTWIKQTK